MSFIKQFLFNEMDIKILPNEQSEQTNVFTVIIGKNSVGKSRLLGSIINHTLVDNYLPKKKVIAISNTSYNKFPKLKDEMSNYVKLLPLPTAESIMGFGIPQKFNEDKIEELLDYSSSNSINYKLKANIYMDVKRLLPKLLVKIKENSEFTYKNLAEVLNFLGLGNSLIIRLIIRKNIFEKIKNNNKFNNEIIRKIEKINSLNISLEELVHLDPIIIDMILLQVIDIFRIYINNRKLDKKINYRELSSGQLAILSMGLALICELENNSLICIDEPEVNLHPQWQEEIINLIESISKNYINCQFLIATHSPQIISNLTCPNSYVLDLNSNVLKSTEDLKNRSADFQLTEVFSSPGNNNEYLIRKLLIILSKVNSNHPLNNEEIHTKDLVKKLYFEEKFQDKDKVKTLVELLLDLEG